MLKEAAKIFNANSEIYNNCWVLTEAEMKEYKLNQQHASEPTTKPSEPLKINRGGRGFGGGSGGFSRPGGGGGFGKPGGGGFKRGFGGPENHDDGEDAGLPEASEEEPEKKVDLDSVIGYEAAGGSKIYCIPRPNEGTSRKYADLVNHFGNNGGYE